MAITLQKRLLFAFMSTVGAIGIWLSGYDAVHWLVYLPTVFMAFAAVTGICPGLIIWKKLGFS